MGQPREPARSERIFDHPFLSLRCDRFIDAAQGAEKLAFLIEIANWVNVVAFDDQDRVLLVTQFRFGTRAMTHEIPGGAIDPGETPLEAAQRELREETGFQADEWVEVGVVEPNPAIQGNRCTTFVARGLRRVANFDPDEIDAIAFVPLDEVRRWMRTGIIQHALVIAAMFFALDSRGG